MQDKIGNEYEGRVSGVTEWGIYVEIEPTKVEGMVSLRDIKEDYFIFDEKNYCVFGKSTKARFTLGDKVRIKVSKVNVEQKLIDYELIWDESYCKAGKRGGARKETKREKKSVGKVKESKSGVNKVVKKSGNRKK